MNGHVIMALNKSVSPMTDSVILVFGGGPAGAAVAIGMARLGYRVTLIAKPRPFDAVEGVSERVIKGMSGAGFKLALEEMAEPSARQVTWNGETNDANTEHLVSRKRFDQALLLDLSSHGVNVISGRIRSYACENNQYQVAVDCAEGGHRQVFGDFIVEARGRAAPTAGLPRVKGTPTVSLLQHWHGPPSQPCSAVESFADGWSWMAAQPDGRRYLQLTVDAASADLPPKHQLANWCRERLEGLHQARPFIDRAEPVGDVYGRTSTAILCERSVADRWIRVGDAAMAVDPLSGNGMFQALSSALQAPAVVNTLIRHPERAELAKQFHETRIEGLFYRFARIGRDFYLGESRWGDRPFWQARREWPDTHPIHRDVTPADVTTALRPVVKDGLIDEERVVITPDQPTGVWHLNGLPLAHLLDTIRSQPQRSPTSVLTEQLGPEKGQFIALWLAKQGWV